MTEEAPEVRTLIYRRCRVFPRPWEWTKLRAHSVAHAYDRSLHWNRRPAVVDAGGGGVISGGQTTHRERSQWMSVGH